MRTVVITAERSNHIRSDGSEFVSIGDGLEVQIPKNAASSTEWIIKIRPYKTPYKLSHTFLGNRLFVANKLELLSEIRGNMVVSQNSTQHTITLENQAPKTIPNFRTQIFASFFDHIFYVLGKTLYWTDIHNPWEWLPHVHNEADFRSLDWEQQDATALVATNDRLWLHFPDSIYEIKYIGKPTIIAMQQTLRGVGALSPQTILQHAGQQFFLGFDNFYHFNPETGLQPIGDDIWLQFVKSRGDLQDIWSYIDFCNNELCWVSNGIAWCFNYKKRQWYKISLDAILHQTTIPSRKKSTSITNADQLQGINNFWVSAGMIYRDCAGVVEMDKWEFSQLPYLESSDYEFENIHFMKRCDLIAFTAKQEWPWESLSVSIGVNASAFDSASFVEVGRWRAEDVSDQIDFPAMVGKSFRFRFALNTVFDLQTRKYNGKLLYDGLRLPTTSAGISGSFQMVSWGFRVDLPQQMLPGPEK